MDTHLLKEHTLKCTEDDEDGRVKQMFCKLNDPVWQLTNTNGRIHASKVYFKFLTLLLTRLCVNGLKIELYRSKATNVMKNTETK